jgi:hypothetical protein
LEVADPSWNGFIDCWANVRRNLRRKVTILPEVLTELMRNCRGFSQRSFSQQLHGCIMPRDSTYATTTYGTGTAYQDPGVLGLNAPSMLDLVFHERKTEILVEDISLWQADGTFQVERGFYLYAGITLRSLCDT